MAWAQQAKTNKRHRRFDTHRLSHTYTHTHTSRSNNEVARKQKKKKRNCNCFCLICASASIMVDSCTTYCRFGLLPQTRDPRWKKASLFCDDIHLCAMCVCSYCVRFVYVQLCMCVLFVKVNARVCVCVFVCAFCWASKRRSRKRRKRGWRRWWWRSPSYLCTRVQHSSKTYSYFSSIVLSMPVSITMYLLLHVPHTMCFPSFARCHVHSIIVASYHSMTSFFVWIWNGDFALFANIIPIRDDDSDFSWFDSERTNEFDYGTETNVPAHNFMRQQHTTHFGIFVLTFVHNRLQM